MGLLLRDKQAKVFSLLKGKSAYLSEIAKETGTTYVYVTNFMKAIQQRGLATIQSTGKKKVVSLTEKGKEVANAVEELRRKLE